jgi:hypothetical protein
LHVLVAVDDAYLRPAVSDDVVVVCCGVRVCARAKESNAEAEKSETEMECGTAGKGARMCRRVCGAWDEKSRLVLASTPSAQKCRAGGAWPQQRNAAGLRCVRRRRRRSLLSACWPSRRPQHQRCRPQGSYGPPAAARSARTLKRRRGTSHMLQGVWRRAETGVFLLRIVGLQPVADLPALRRAIIMLLDGQHAVV